MKAEDRLKAEIVAIEHCAMRSTCPIGKLCGTSNNKEPGSLFPSVFNVKQGDLLWTDLRSEQRVYIVKSGVFSCMAYLGSAREVSFALYGSGTCFGMAELYMTTSDVSSMYHMRAVLPSCVCSVPAKALRRHLESKPNPFSQKVLVTSLVNQATSALFQSAILMEPLLYDRVVFLLSVISTLAERSGQVVSNLTLTHSEIAALVMSDRVSTTRVLHKMAEDGLISLGYKSISLNSKFWMKNDEAVDVCSRYFAIDDL